MEKEFGIPTICYICGNKITKDDDGILDHDLSIPLCIKCFEQKEEDLEKLKELSIEQRLQTLEAYHWKYIHETY